MPGSSSTNNSRTTPAQVKTSTIFIPKTAVGRIIGRIGNKTNKRQSQNNVEITTSLTVNDCQDVKITGNTNNINNALKEISEIVLCKYFSSDCCTYGPDCKFQHINNIEIKNSQQPNGNIHFNITHGICNAEIQNSKKLAKQRDNKATNTCSQSHRRPNYTNAKSKSTNRKYTSINKRLFTPIASSSKAVRRSKKMKQENYPKISRYQVSSPKCNH